MLCNKGNHCNEKPAHNSRVAPTLHNQRKPTYSNKDEVQPKVNKLIKYIHVCICVCIRPPPFLCHPTQIPFRDLESLTYQLLPIPTSSHLTLPSMITAQECSLGPQHTAHTVSHAEVLGGGGNTGRGTSKYKGPQHCGAKGECSLSSL